MAITEFAGIFNLGGQAGNFLKVVAPDQPGMIGSATGDDEETANVVSVEIELLKNDARGFPFDAAKKSVGKNFRRFKNLFVHEVLVAGFFR